MKIDTHQHFWHYRPEDFPWVTPAMPTLQRDRLPADGLVAQQGLTDEGVTGVLAVQARCLSAETDFLLQLAAQNPHILGVVGWANLTAPLQAADMERWCANPAFKGLRHIVQDEADVAAWVKTARTRGAVRELQRKRKVYDVLVFAHQLPTIYAFCIQHDAYWLVLDHLGKPNLQAGAAHDVARLDWQRAVTALGSLPHVMCKISGLVTQTESGNSVTASDVSLMWSCFDHALASFGPQRILFGSDWPVCELAASYSEVHSITSRWAQSRLSTTEQLAFWGGNAERCYNLNGH